MPSPTPAPTPPTGLPAGVRAFPVNYWDGMTPDEAAEYFDPSNGLHANKGETAAVLAINPDLVDMERANVEFPPFPEVTNAAAVHTAFFFSAPGSVYRATHSGTWGDAREATPEFGERYLDGRRPRRRSGCSTTSSGRSPRCRRAELESRTSRPADRLPRGWQRRDRD